MRERGLSLQQVLDRRSIPEPNSGCTLWFGALSHKGYGRLRYKGQWMKAHRAAWACKHGPVPPGMMVCHKCDVRPCINVNHLFLGTAADNNADMVAKGRHCAGSGGGGFAIGVDHPNARFTVEQIKEIRADPRNNSEVARLFATGPTTIRGIRLRRTWAHVA